MAKAISRIRDLIIKHLKEELTADEYQELQEWIHLSEDNSIVFSQLTDPDSLSELLQASHELKASIRNKIEARIRELSDHSPEYLVADPSLAEPEEGKLVYLPNTSQNKKAWLYAAAACLAVVFTGAYLWMAHRSHLTSAEHVAPLSKNDVAPGGDKAILTLANGSTIILENTANGNLGLQGNSHVSKDKNLLAYTVSKNIPSGNTSSSAPIPSSTVYNTLTTPRAGQFKLILPDGSKVWLNNASSLRYPTSFTGKSREVALSGEAYFEIAKDAAKPFTVKLADLAVDVLGTSFNITAYGDDPVVKTTLLTGKISVAAAGAVSSLSAASSAPSSSSASSIPSSSAAAGKDPLAAGAGKQSILSPGEQAVISHVGEGTGSWKILKGVDTQEAIAWQRGYFHFTHENIGDVLRQLGRWYDVEIQFRIPMPDYTFDGEIDRDLNLSSILRHLEKKDLHFQIDGKKLIVSK